MNVLSMIQGRLALIGLAVGLAIIAGLWFRLDHVEGQRAAERAAKEIAIAANAANTATIAALEDRVRQLDEINTRLFDRYTAINSEDDEQRRAVENLADADQNVADFLEQPLPDELARVLFDTRAGGGDTGGAEAAGSAREPTN